MSVTSNHAVEIGDVVLGQITNMATNFGNNLVVARQAGEIDPSFSTAGKVESKASFTSTEVSRVLAELGIGYVGLTGVNTLDLYERTLQAGGVNAAGASHNKYTINSGILVPQNLTANTDSPAEISYEATGVFDGTNNPIVYATGQSLPSLPASTEMFFAGAVTLNGVAIGKIKSINVDFGYTLNEVQTDGEAFPCFVNIGERNPKITIETLDVPTAFSVAGTVGVGHTVSSDIYLRKAADGGARVANATAEHIKLSSHSGSIFVTESSGGSDGQRTAKIEITPVYDRTNDILTVSAAAAIV